MEVRVADVVLLSVNGESTISVRSSVLLANFSKSVAPVLDHTLLLYINVSIIGRGMFLLFLIMIQRRKD